VSNDAVLIHTTGTLTLSNLTYSSTAASTLGSGTVSLSGVLDVSDGSLTQTGLSTVDSVGSIALSGGTLAWDSGSAGGSLAIGGVITQTGGTLAFGAKATTVADAVTISAGTLNLGSGSLSLTTAGKAISVTPAFSLTANGASVTTNGGDAAFSGAIDGGYSFSVNVQGGKASFASPLGQTTPLASFLVTSTNAGADAILIKSTATSGNQNYSGNVTISTSPETILLGTLVTLSGNVTAAPAGLNLTVTGNAVLGAIAANAFGGIGALSVSGTTTINAGSITTVSGGQTYTGAVTLASNTSLASTGGDLVFSNTIDGAMALTLNAGGAVSVTGAVGGSTALTALIVAGSTGSTFQGDVSVGTLTLTNTTGTIAVDGKLVATVGMSAAANNFSIALNQGAGAQATTVAGATILSNSGALMLGNDAADTVLFSGGLNAITQSATTFQGTVSTGGADAQDMTLNRLDVGPGGLTLNLGLGDLVVIDGAATMTVINANTTVNAALVNLGSLTVDQTRNATFVASAASGVTIGTATINGPNLGTDVTTSPSDTGPSNGVLDIGASNFAITTLKNTGILRLTGEQSGSHSIANGGIDSGIIEYYEGSAAGTVFDDIVSTAPNYYHLRINASSRTFAVNGDIGVAADVVLEGGTFALGSTTLTVGGYWINRAASGAGAFASGTGTVKFVPNTARLPGRVIKVYGDNTWWIFWCESPGTVILFENEKTQQIASGGIFDVKGTTSSHVTLSRLYKTTAGPVPGTEDPTLLPDADYYPEKPPAAGDAPLFWKFDLIPGATFAMGYVDVFYSDASADPVSIPPTVYAMPYNDAKPPAVSHYSYKWLSFLFAMYSYTEDSDYDGKIDRIRVTTEAAVDNDFTGFEVEVQGYTVTGYSRPSLGNTFFINLQEKPYLDTGVTPDWHIVKNTTLLDDQYRTQYVATLLRSDGSDWMTPGDTAWPVVGYTLALPGLAAGVPDTYVHLSESVVTSASGTPTDADLGLSGVPAYSIISGSGSGVQTVLGRAPVALSIVNIADNSTYLGLTPTLMDMGKPPHWEEKYNNLIVGPPAPTYPPSSGYTPMPNDYAQLLPAPDPRDPSTMTLSRPDFQLQGGMGKTTHRVSDVLISVPPSDLYPSSYFVWPLWAKDQVSLTLSDAEITAMTPLQTAQMGPGLIRAFDGTQWLRDQDITLQAILANGITSPTLLFDSKVSSTLTTSNGLWLPAFNEASTVAEIGFSGLVPYSDQPPLGRGAESSAGTRVSTANLWNFSILSSDPRVVSVSPLGFFFTVTPSAPAGQQPLYCARLAIDAGTAIPANWYSLVLPFSFEIHDLTLQRGSVTILNNVIDPTKGETVRLSYTLGEAGATTITVFTLDGDVVRRLEMATKAAGEYSTYWDGTNLAGLPVARGVYFIRVVAPGVDEIRKVMIIRR